ncbi:plasmid partitioning protein RepB C-terminal domain-containing protein [Magnetospirillum sp. UT-4]|uniref:plasmid partitioning protein RepB C-terminal domain-containing protein n=1 Tax=Magnetospirillum sp. UT-4 TaxID=2681467 RepID=UPI0013863D12|nr:plasmid partitioning protein RepB C-terminal domain-containing protein [Magnetospirillum sp. UT-4]CAA7615665.1 RepB/ParB plasmid partition protein [Magnetospirillum sp. UT-4]
MTVTQGFEGTTIVVSVDRILPTRKLPRDFRQTPKYRSILASVREVGIIDPLAVHPEKGGGSGDGLYILLDGHLRLEALKELGGQQAVCLVSTDDEGFTYNKRINRTSPIQEHRMILKAIEKGASPERIASALAINVERIRERQRLLDGIAPEVVEMLKDRMLSQEAFAVLRKMKPIRQIAAVEMMVSANRFTISYVKMLLATTRPEHLVDGAKPKPAAGVSPEDIARMEREMDKLQQDYRAVEETLGETTLALVVARGFLGKLMGNGAVADYLDRHHGDLVGELRRMVAETSIDPAAVEQT